MIAAGLIHDVADFYQLTVDDIAGLDTGRTYASSNSKKGVKKGDPIPVGLKTAEKIIAELNKSKSQPLGRVLFALASVPRLRRASSSSWPCPRISPCWNACARRVCRSRSIWAPHTRKLQLTLAWRASSPMHSHSRV